MSSITTWQRLEPLPRSDDLRPGLRAEIADPLWLLARQRQFGELRGEDAGSPIQARFDAMSGRISRLHRGRPGTDAATLARDHDDRQLPLEVAVEREVLRSTPAGGGLAVEAGLHFLRLLRVHRAAAARANAYIEHYAVTLADLPGPRPPQLIHPDPDPDPSHGPPHGPHPDPPPDDSELDADTARLRRRAIGRVPDGRRLFADLAEARGGAPELADLPAEPAVPVSDRPKVLAAANAFLRRWDALLSEPDESEPSAWQPTRLEHAFAVQAELPSGRVVLRADEYRGGHLDWHSFTAADGPDLGSPTTPREADHTVRTVLPSPAAYGGMPASRFWEIEDGSVRFGALTTGRTDLARLLLAEFALTYGNDWFVVPIDLPVGSVCSVDQFEITDTFGEVTPVERSTSPPTGPDGSAWRLFEVSAPDAPDRVSQLFFLAPALAEIAESDPVEEVALIRDEMANIVWGVERRYQGAAGSAVDRYAEHQRRLAQAVATQHVDNPIGDAQLIYRLATDVPYHWYPFVPVRPEGASGLDAVIQLERRPLIRVLVDGHHLIPQPRGRILVDDDPLRLEEEEVPRSGTDVVRTFQLARWIDGRYLLWSGRHRLTGGGEGSSGLRFDSVSPALR